MTNIGEENETMEFKEGIGQLDKGIRSMSAMLNRHHHGKVYFGVNDDGDVIGMDVGDSTLEKIRNAVRTDIAPRVIPEITILESDDGKRYISVEFNGHSVPYSYKEKYFIRNQTSDESADQEILAQIFMTRGMDPLKDMRSDIQELTFEHLFALLVAHGHHPRKEDGYYRSIGLLDDKGGFNLNAYLLSDQNQIPMQVVEFKGTDRSEMNKRTDFGKCCMLKSMDSIAEYIFGHMETEVDTSGIERKDRPLFDKDSFREAWVNACVHNSWASHIPPSVMIFDDRLEIVSYGRIPFPLSTDDFYSGDSRPVNPTLFSIFAKLNRIEQSGHGVPRIVRSYGKGAFHITESGLKVTIPFSFTPSFVTTRRSNNEIRKTLDKDMGKVLDCMERDPFIKLNDISKETGITLSSVKKIVMSLKEKGLLVNEGTNRNSKWTVTY